MDLDGARAVSQGRGRQPLDVGKNRLLKLKYCNRKMKLLKNSVKIHIYGRIARLCSRVRRKISKQEQMYSI